MELDVDFAHCYVRPECPQLFFLFTGNAENLQLHPMDFMRKTGIADRNIVIVRDAHQAGYRKGVSKEVDSLDAIVQWQRELLSHRFPHVREVFCAGSSGGGGPAIYTGHHLEAKAVWSFAGRLPRPSIAAAGLIAKTEFLRRVLGRDHVGPMTRDESERFWKAVQTPEVRQMRWDLGENPDTVLDRDFLAQLVGLLREKSTATHYHLYYAVTNCLDEVTAEAFRGCPGVTIHPIMDLSPERMFAAVILTDPDHLVIMILDRMNKLSPVFSGYL